MNRTFFLRTSILFLAIISMFSVVGFSQAKPKVCVVMNAIIPNRNLPDLMFPSGEHYGGGALWYFDNNHFREGASKGFYEMYLSYILSQKRPVQQRGPLLEFNSTDDFLLEKITDRLRVEGCEVDMMGRYRLTDFIMKTFQQRCLPQNLQVTTITPSLVAALKKHTGADILVFINKNSVSYNVAGQKSNKSKHTIYDAVTQALFISSITAGRSFDDLSDYDYSCVAEDRWSATSASLLQKKTLPELVSVAIGNVADSLASDLLGKDKLLPVLNKKEIVCFVDNSLASFGEFGIPDYLSDNPWLGEGFYSTATTKRDAERFGDSVFIPEFSMPRVLFNYNTVNKNPGVKTNISKYYGSNKREVIFGRSSFLNDYISLMLSSQGRSVAVYSFKMGPYLAQQTKTPYIKNRWTPGSYTPASLYKDPRIVDIDQPFLDELYRLTKADKIVVGGAVVMNFEILGNRSSDKESVSGTQWMTLEYPLEIYNGNQKETKIFKGEFRNTLDKVTDGRLHRIYELYQMYGLCMEQIREQMTKVLAEI